MVPATIDKLLKQTETQVRREVELSEAKVSSLELSHRQHNKTFNQ